MLKTLFDSVAAGILIAIGGCVFLACDNRYIGAGLFSVALLCICYMDYYLFTGKIGFWPVDASLRNTGRLLLGLAGNLATVFLLGLVVRYALPELARNGSEIFTAKLSQSVGQTAVRAAFCGVLMYLSVQIFREKRTPIGILFCIPVFILSGFEHSIADMFYFGTSGLSDLRTVTFFAAVIFGNAAGSLLLPMLGKIGGKGKK